MAVTNFTNGFRRLRKGTVIGQIKPVENDYDIFSVNSVNEGKSSTCRELPPVEEIRSQIHTDSEYKTLIEDLVLKNVDVFALTIQIFWQVTGSK